MTSFDTERPRVTRRRVLKEFPDFVDITSDDVIDIVSYQDEPEQDRDASRHTPTSPDTTVSPSYQATPPISPRSRAKYYAEVNSNCGSKPPSHHRSLRQRLAADSESSDTGFHPTTTEATSSHITPIASQAVLNHTMQTIDTATTGRVTPARYPPDCVPAPISAAPSGRRMTTKDAVDMAARIRRTQYDKRSEEYDFLLTLLSPSCERHVQSKDHVYSVSSALRLIREYVSVHGRGSHWKKMPDGRMGKLTVNQRNMFDHLLWQMGQAVEQARSDVTADSDSGMSDASANQAAETKSTTLVGLDPLLAKIDNLEQRMEAAVAKPIPESQMRVQQQHQATLEAVLRRMDRLELAVTRPLHPSRMNIPPPGYCTPMSQVRYPGRPLTRPRQQKWTPSPSDVAIRALTKRLNECEERERKRARADESTSSQPVPPYTETSAEPGQPFQHEPEPVETTLDEDGHTLRRTIRHYTIEPC